jgi:hypothetical protein
VRTCHRHKPEYPGLQHSGAVFEGIDDTGAHERRHANPRLPAKVDAVARKPLLGSEAQPGPIGTEANLPLLPQPCASAFDVASRHGAVSNSFKQIRGLHGASSEIITAVPPATRQPWQPLQ